MIDEPLCLTPEQVKDVTGKIYPSAQARALDAMGIPNRRRGDGSVLVFTHDLIDRKRTRRQPQPDYGALHVAQEA